MRFARSVYYGIAILLTSYSSPAAATSPTIAVMPGAGKSLEQFQSDDTICRNFAQSQSAQPQQTALGSPAGTVAKTTAGGAAAGALFGAAGGNAGKGAAIGAGAGLVGGMVRGARQSSNAAQSLQQSYDIAYAQCMQTKGNTVPANAFSQ